MLIETLVPLLRCPRCRRDDAALTLAAGDAAFTCVSCGTAFPIEAGIANFLPAEIRAADAPVEDVPRQKWQQRAWHDTHELAEWNITDPHHAPLKEYCLYRQMGSAADMLPARVRPRVTLNICCGSGLEAEFFASRFGAPVVGTDISVGMLRNAVERARRGGYPFIAVCADSENLPFRSGSVDAAFVLHGLHHLAEPAAGLVEMARVSRDAVLVFEPASSPVRRFMMRIGVVSEIEESGNVSYDFSESTGFERLLQERGFAHVQFRRELWSLMVSEVRMLNRSPLIRMARLAFEWLHRGPGRRWGTKLSLVAWRERASG